MYEVTICFKELLEKGWEPTYWVGDRETGYFISEKMTDWFRENGITTTYVYHIPSEEDRNDSWVSTGITFLFNDVSEATFFKMKWA